MEFSVIQTTCSSKEEAIKLSKILLEKRVAACVQLTPIESLYVYENRLHDEKEYLLSIKTAARHYENIEALIKEHHSYDIPEIIELSIKQGSKEYLQWAARALS